MSGQTTLEAGDGNSGQIAVSYCQSRPATYLTLEGRALLLLGGVPRQVGDMVLVLEVLCCLHIARGLSAFQSSSEVYGYPAKVSPRMAFCHLQAKCQHAEDFLECRMPP